MGTPAATRAWLEAEAWVSKLEEKLTLERDPEVSTTVLDSGLADQVREQDDKSEIRSGISVQFAKLGGRICQGVGL